MIMKVYFVIASSFSLVESWVTPPNQIINVILPTTTNLLMATGPGGGRGTKEAQQNMLDTINTQPTESNVDQSRLPNVSPNLDDLAPLIQTMAIAADKRKADNIVAMRISKLSTVASFVVICSGNSRPQNQAIAAAIKDEVAEVYGEEWVIRGNGVPEGDADSGWILLDYGDVMVHVMTPKSRLFYDIEGQWREKGGEYMDLEDVLVKDVSPKEEKEKAAEVGTTMLGIAEEDDPFWS